MSHLSCSVGAVDNNYGVIQQMQLYPNFKCLAHNFMLHLSALDFYFLLGGVVSEKYIPIFLFPKVFFFFHDILQEMFVSI